MGSPAKIPTPTPPPEVTADEDGVRIQWPLSDGHSITAVADLIGNYAKRFPTYTLDWCEFAPTGLILDFINPAAAL